MSSSKKKPTVSLRAPGSRKLNQDFIQGTSDEAVADLRQAPETSRRSDVETSERLNVQTSDEKIERRRTTVYFDADVYKRLRVHCAMEDAEISSTISAIVASWLDEHSNA